MLSSNYLSKATFAKQLCYFVVVSDEAPYRRQVDLVSVKVSLVIHDYIFNYNHLIKKAAINYSQCCQSNVEYVKKLLEKPILNE